MSRRGGHLRAVATLCRALLLAATALALTACLSDNHAQWWIGDVAPDWHDCRAIDGARTVLDLKEFRASLVIPFAWGGFRLFVLTEERHLEPGSTLTVPSAEASAVLCDLRHGASGDAITDVRGTVQVVRRRGEDVLLRLDLDGNRGYWSHHGKQWFERQGRPAEAPRLSASPSPR